MNSQVRTLKRMAGAGLGPLTIGVVWSFASHLPACSLLLPGPGDVLSELMRLIVTADFLFHTGMSTFRVTTGLLLALLLGVPAGLCIGRACPSSRFLSPLISFSRYIPPSAFTPLVVLWFGVSEYGRLFLLVCGISPYVAVMTADALRKLPEGYLLTCRLLGGAGSELRTVVVPYLLPDICEIARVNFGAAWTILVLAELLGSQRGLGHVMTYAQRVFNLPRVFAIIVLLGVIGLLCDRAVGAAGRRLFPWR